MEKTLIEQIQQGQVELEDLNHADWEALCDRCGLCCLHKIQDEDTDEFLYANVACQLLDVECGNCKDYPNRRDTVPECVQLGPKEIREFVWIPQDCAYRRVMEHRPLASWHPLISGRDDSVEAAGQSVVNLRPYEEHEVEDITDYIMEDFK
jgi:uncharacterized cysteine cluster protein YcgN (CxxCxxCC family)